ncbi:MAG TPA: PHB depolymerase family esterase [Polyangiaceae bacterium]
MLRRTLALVLFLAACEQRKTAPASEPATATNADARTPSAAPATTNDASSAREASSGNATAGPVPSGVNVPGAGDSTPELGLGAAVVHVPASLPPGEKAPLIVILHGLGATSAAIDRFSDFASFAETKRIAWVAPDGPKDSKGRQFWNAGSTCCNFDGMRVDHVAALRALVERAVASKPIDAKRVYAVGYSNGGFMAHRLGCELDGLFAGIASVAGAGPKPGEPCPAKGPLRVLQVHGDADTIVNIAGGPLFADRAYPSSISAAETILAWAKRLDCAAKPRSAGNLDFEAKLPGPETSVERFETCKRGAVALWTVGGGGHYIGLREPSYEVMWKFLSGS